MLDLQHRGFLIVFPAVEPFDDGPLGLLEALRRGVRQRTHRDHRKTRIKLDRGHRIAGRGADKGLLEPGMRDRFGGTDESRAELHAGAAHLQISHDRLAPADAAGHEDGHVGHLGQDFLGQHRGGHGADMPAGLHALDDQRIGPRAYQLLG